MWQQSNQSILARNSTEVIMKQARKDRLRTKARKDCKRKEGQETGSLSLTQERYTGEQMCVRGELVFRHLDVTVEDFVGENVFGNNQVRSRWLTLREGKD